MQASVCGLFSVVCSYALGDLLEMAGYGLTQRAASSVQISGLCSDPYKVRRVDGKLPSQSLRVRGLCECGLERLATFLPV